MIAVAVGGDHHGLVLTELDGVAGVLDERRDVGAEEHLAVADADHQRRGPPGRDDRARLVGVGEHQREVALQPRQHGQHRCRRSRRRCRPVVVLPADQVHGDLGVGVAGELDARRLQLGAQRREVLDDAVVDHGDLARCVAVRVGVAVGRPAVGGPAGVAHARCCRSAPSASASASAASRLASRPARRRTVIPPRAVEQRRRPPSRSRGTPSGAAHRRRCRRQDAARRSRRFRTWPSRVVQSARSRPRRELRSSGGQDEEALRCADPPGSAPRSAR